MCAKQKRKTSAVSTCEAKVAWPSRGLAERAIKKQIRRLDDDGKDRQLLSTYRCPVCRRWHAGRDDVQRLRHEKHGRVRKPVKWPGPPEDEE